MTIKPRRVGSKLDLVLAGTKALAHDLYLRYSLRLGTLFFDYNPSYGWFTFYGRTREFS
jgi:hypothetical protein